MNPCATIYGLDLSRPCVMAIVNVTPDSFYAGSRTFSRAQIMRRVEQVIEQGCSIIDIGGFSSRPGADDVPAEEEWRRVELGLRCVREISADIPVSVDTFRSAVASRAIESDGRIIINDISAGMLDSGMSRVVAAAGVPYIAMHMRGTPATMQQHTGYADVASEVGAWLRGRVSELLSHGIKRENIILDAGFGFAKSADECFALLAGLRAICSEGYPVLAGLSRKSFIYNTLGTDPEHCLAGTAALNWEALRQGVSILRVHDVREACDTILLYNRYKNNLQ